MAVDNVFTITYGGTAVGGTSDTYQLHGAYTLNRSFSGISVGFTVTVVGTSHANLASLSSTLEAAFRQRLEHGETLIINLNGSTFTFTSGTDILNATASITKTGGPADQGFSRSYAIEVVGDVPADSTSRSGLRELLVDVAYGSSRQKIVTMTGVYTATGGASALAQYQSAFDSEASAYLTAIDSGATFELTAEGESLDRNRSADNSTPFAHSCSFSRTYTELLADQSQSGRDDTSIRDHTMHFTDSFDHLGAGAEQVYTMRRVNAAYDCAIDIDQSTDLYALFENTVLPHVKALFESNFAPQVFAVESQRVAYNETSKRLSASVTFVYQATEGAATVAATQRLTTTATRQLDETPVHSGGELDRFVDVGFGSLQRVWTREALVIGDANELAGGSRSGGPVGGPSSSPLFGSPVGSGWTVVSEESTAEPKWIGDPASDQIAITLATDVRVERYYSQPTSGTTGTPGSGGGEFTFPTAAEDLELRYGRISPP